MGGILNPMPTVSRNARLLDLGSLLCIIAGALLFYTASGRLHEIGKLSYRHPGPAGQSALDASDHALYLALGGVALILTGCSVGVGGVISAARRKRLSP